MPPAGQAHHEPTVSAHEHAARRVVLLPRIGDRALGRRFQIVPRLHDMGIGLAPLGLDCFTRHVHVFLKAEGLVLFHGPLPDGASLGQRLIRNQIRGLPAQLVQIEAVGQGHVHERHHPAPVAEGQFHALALLALVLGDIVGLLVVRPRHRQDIKILAPARVQRREGVQLPLFTGQPGGYPAFDIAPVTNHQLFAWGRDHDPAQRVGAHRAQVVAEQIHGVRIPRLEQPDTRLDVRVCHRRPGQVLRLIGTAGPSRGAGGTGKHQRMPHPVVLAYAILEAGVFGGGCHRGLDAQFQQLARMIRQPVFFQHVLDVLFTKRFENNPVLFQQVREQLVALRGRFHDPAGDRLHALVQLLLVILKRVDRGVHQLHVRAEASLVDTLVDTP